MTRMGREKESFDSSGSHFTNFAIFTGDFHSRGLTFPQPPMRGLRRKYPQRLMLPWHLVQLSLSLLLSFGVSATCASSFHGKSQPTKSRTCLMIISNNICVPTLTKPRQTLTPWSRSTKKLPLRHDLR